MMRKAARITAYVLAVLLTAMVGRVAVPIDVEIVEIALPRQPGQPRMMAWPATIYKVPLVGRLEGDWVPAVVSTVSILVLLLVVFLPGLIWRRSFIAAAHGRLLIAVLIVGVDIVLH